jgi:hypothetical protein
MKQEFTFFIFSAVFPIQEPKLRPFPLTFKKDKVSLAPNMYRWKIFPKSNLVLIAKNIPAIVILAF